MALSDFNRWLAGQLMNVNSVRTITRDRETNDLEATALVALTWSSSVIKVYTIDAEPRTRAIRKIVTENTRVGIGTLFLLNADFVPADGERCVPDESLWVLHALFKDKIYTYRYENQEPKIGQVHFKSYGRSDEVEVWYGPDIEIRSLPSYRVTVKPPSPIKGDWLMANLGSPPFWKQADYSAGRDAFRQQQRAGYTYRAEWSQTSWDATSGRGHTEYEDSTRSPAAAAQTRLDKCYVQLGVGQTASYDEIKAAFRRLARELHPDVSTLPKSEAETRFKTLNEAYAYIKSSKGWQ